MDHPNWSGDDDKPGDDDNDDETIDWDQLIFHEKTSKERVVDDEDEDLFPLSGEEEIFGLDDNMLAQIVKGFEDEEEEEEDVEKPSSSSSSSAAVPTEQPRRIKKNKLDALSKELAELEAASLYATLQGPVRQLPKDICGQIAGTMGFNEVEFNKKWAQVKKKRMKTDPDWAKLPKGERGQTTRRITKYLRDHPDILDDPEKLAKVFHQFDYKASGAEEKNKKKASGEAYQRWYNKNKGTANRRALEYYHQNKDLILKKWKKRRDAAKASDDGGLKGTSLEDVALLEQWRAINEERMKQDPVWAEQYRSNIRTGEGRMFESMLINDFKQNPQKLEALKKKYLK
jgi:hypothetical protein